MTRTSVAVNQTTTSIQVSYEPEAVEGYQVAARNSRIGSFVGECDEPSRTCTVGGLYPGSIYRIWVRNCTRNPSGHTNCDLRAKEFNAATEPLRKSSQSAAIVYYGSCFTISFFRLAPSEVSTTGISTSAISVAFPAPDSRTAISSYKAIIKGRSEECTVAANANPRMCSITGLKAGTEYTILVSAFVNSLQGDAAEVLGSTLPNGESHTSHAITLECLVQEFPNCTTRVLCNDAFFEYLVLLKCY